MPWLQVDIGYACSVCLSVFCQRAAECSTCGTAFAARKGSAVKRPLAATKSGDQTRAIQQGAVHDKGSC